MTAAIALPTDTLLPFVATYRPDEMQRFEVNIARYGGSRETAEALARELFGMPLELVLAGDPATLGPDWRDSGLRRAVA